MTRFATTVLVVGVIAGAEVQQRSDPWLGVWVLDSERSPLPNANVKSQRLVLEIVAGGLRYAAVNIDQKDQERVREVILPLDGSEAVLGAGQRYSYRRVDALTFERVTKDNGGRVVSILRTQVSKDGRALTQTTALANGQPADDPRIFTRHQ